MRLLVTSAHPTLLQYQQAHLGRLIQPRHYSSIEQTAASGMPWAADNDAYNGGFDARAFRTMLDRIAGLPGCRFVAAPDVVGDWEATRDLWKPWLEEIVTRKLPAALVAQDGLKPWCVPWSQLDALFIGGTTEWKMGEEAALLIRVAQAHDKWVHFGRVNSTRRVRYAYSLNCDSADGSKYAVYRDTYLPAALAFLASGQQLPLSEETA